MLCYRPPEMLKLLRRKSIRWQHEYSPHVEENETSSPLTTSTRHTQRVLVTYNLTCKIHSFSLTFPLSLRAIICLHFLHFLWFFFLSLFFPTLVSFLTIHLFSFLLIPMLFLSSYKLTKLNKKWKIGHRLSYPKLRIKYWYMRGMLKIFRPDHFSICFLFGGGKALWPKTFSPACVFYPDQTVVSLTKLCRWAHFSLRFSSTQRLDVKKTGII